MSNSCGDKFKALVDFAEMENLDWNIPGLSFGISYGGRSACASLGVTNLDHPLAVTTDTLFQIGSVTKTFVATAIMRLVEEKKLRLDDTVQSLIPNFRVADQAASAKATVWHLLTHTSGWVGDVFKNTGTGDDALARYVADMADLEQLAPIGQAFSYNNSAFTVLGHIIERVTEKTFEVALKDLVLEPLELNNTYLKPIDVMTRRFVVGHNNYSKGLAVARPWGNERSGIPQGGIICDINDLLRYADFHLGDGTTKSGTRLLSFDLVAEMHAPHTMIWTNEHWGLGWSVELVDGEWWISHRGVTNGQVCILRLAPSRKFGVAVLTNAQHGAQAAERISSEAMRLFLGIEPSAPSPRDSTATEFAELVGIYVCPFSEVRLSLRNASLAADVTYLKGFPNEEAQPFPAPPTMNVDLCGNDRLVVLDGAYIGQKVEVLRGTDGSIESIRFDGRIHVHRR